MNSCGLTLWRDNSGATLRLDLCSKEFNEVGDSNGIYFARLVHWHAILSARSSPDLVLICFEDALFRKCQSYMAKYYKYIILV